MKKITLLYMVLLFSIGVHAQSSHKASYDGIYMTSQDYSESKLSFIGNCDSTAGKIKLYHFISGKYLVVEKDAKEVKLNKDSIFGYRDCKGQNYRFYKKYDYEYLVKENKGIVIYIALLQDPLYTGKGIKLVPTYFFSKSVNSDIQALTTANLKHAFSGNTKFCNMIDTGVDVTAFDDAHNMYRVSYLLTQSIIN